MNINWTAVTGPLLRASTTTAMKVSKASPHILIGAGLVGVVGTVVLASKATLHLEAIIEDAEEYKEAVDSQLEENDITKTEHSKQLFYIYGRTAGKVIHLYGPALSLGAISIAMILKSHGIMVKRNAAMVAAYNTLDQMYTRYRDETRRTFGDEKEHEIFERVHQDDPFTAYTDEGIVVDQPKTLFDDVSSYAKWFDEGSPYYRRDAQYNRTFLTTQQTFANDRLHSQGHLFLNDVYDSLGLPRTRAGSVVGWILDEGDGYVDFGIFDTDRENARDFINGYEKAVLLDFNVDGLIWDKI